VIALVIIVIITGSFILFATLKQPITTTPPPQSPLISLPSRDVEGRGLSGIPRYMSSIRLYYSNETYGNTTSINIAYYTDNNINEVIGFYETQMPNYNWSLLSKSIVMKKLKIPGTPFEIKSYTLLNFRKSKHSVFQMTPPHAEISVGETILCATKYTIVKIDFTKQCLHVVQS